MGLKVHRPERKWNILEWTKLQFRDTNHLYVRAIQVCRYKKFRKRQ